MRPPVLAESSAWLTVQDAQQGTWNPAPAEHQNVCTLLHYDEVVISLWSCCMGHWQRERERDNVFGPTDLSPWVQEEFILRFFFFSQQKLCSHLNNSSAFQSLWVLFMWMVRDSVDRGFFFGWGNIPALFLCTDGHCFPSCLVLNEWFHACNIRAENLFIHI